jgi:hypothetical protein
MAPTSMLVAHLFFYEKIAVVSVNLNRTMRSELAPDSAFTVKLSGEG